MSQIPELSSLDQLSRLVERSHSVPVWVFKHSSTCEISAVAWEEFRRFAAGRGAAGEERFAVIEVRTARPVSDELARLTGVRHESPQALLLRGGRAVWSASHWQIERAGLERAALAG